MQSSSPPEGPLDKFAVSLAGALAFGTLVAVLALLGRSLDGSWSAALAPFAAGATYAGGLLVLVAAARHQRDRTGLRHLGLVALPVLGALAGVAWAAVHAPRGGWATALGWGVLLGGAHAALARRTPRAGGRGGHDAPAD